MTYQFYLESFQIMDTRSYHADTIVAGIGVIVNGVPRKSVVAQLGDFNNGTYLFWQHGLGSIDRVEIGPNDHFAFAFQLYNNGNSRRPSASELEGQIYRDLINTTADLNSNFPGSSPNVDQMNMMAQKGNGPLKDLAVLLPGGDWNDGKQVVQNLAVTQANFFTCGLFGLLRAVFGGCDGPLGVGLIMGTGALLDARIPAVGPLRLAASFNANTSHFDRPCNASGSNYVVNVIVQRQV